MRAAYRHAQQVANRIARCPASPWRSPPCSCSRSSSRPRMRTRRAGPRSRRRSRPPPGPATAAYSPRAGRSTSCAAARSSTKAKSKRTAERRSLLFFGQLTDPQIADEMSPARVDFPDPRGRRDQVLVAAAGGARPAGLRPGGAQRQRQPHERSATASGKRAKIGFVVTTGDLADNQQLNETRWFKTVLDGGTVDPFSGKPISATNRAPARPPRRSRRSTPPSPRGLHGRRRLRRLSRRPADRYTGFWDPDAAPPAARSPRSRATRMKRGAVLGMWTAVVVVSALSSAVGMPCWTPTAAPRARWRRRSRRARCSRCSPTRCCRRRTPWRACSPVRWSSRASRRRSHSRLKPPTPMSFGVRRSRNGRRNKPETSEGGGDAADHDVPVVRRPGRGGATTTWVPSGPWGTRTPRSP